MFTKTSAIVLALALSTSAAPLVDGVGTRIPIAKRKTLIDEDGWFNHPKAVRQVVRDHNKHRRNLINLKRNMGEESLNKGAHIKPVANATFDLVNVEVAEQNQKRQAVSLTDEGDQYWVGNIAIGSNSKKFVIDFDTGSSDLWIPSVNCTSSPCSSKNKYNPASSTTSVHKSASFSIQYGDGSTVSGPVYTDTVSVAGVTAHNQYFSSVTTLSAEFADEVEDGILGMAFPTISQLNANPFFNSAKAQGVVKAGVFGFKLAKSGSELYLGGTDSSLYTGAIEYHSVIGNGFWQIGNGKLTVGNKTVESGIETIIDSGTTIIYGPPTQVAALYKNIPNSKLYDSANGFYSFPCSSVPSNVAFSWGGNTYTISAANFNFGRVNGTHCIGAIAGQDLGLGENTWLLGDSFMKNVYSAFSIDKNAVGFAKLS